MKLHLNARDSGAAMVEDYTRFLVEGCNQIAPNVWDRFKSDQSEGLLNIGLTSSLIVSISLFSFFFFPVSLPNLIFLYHVCFSVLLVHVEN